MVAHAVPVLFDAGDAPPARWRTAAAGLLLAAALWLVASPVPAMIRLDPVVHSDGVPDRLLADRTERGPDSIGPEVVQARDTLAARGLMDEAEGLYQPLLWVLHDGPAVVLALAAVALAAPRRLSGRGRIRLAVAAAAVGLVMVVPQWLYADTIGAATTITD